MAPAGNFVVPSPRRPFPAVTEAPQPPSHPAGAGSAPLGTGGGRAGLGLPGPVAQLRPRRLAAAARTAPAPRSGRPGAEGGTWGVPGGAPAARTQLTAVPARSPRTCPWGLRLDLPEAISATQPEASPLGAPSSRTWWNPGAGLTVQGPSPGPAPPLRATKPLGRACSLDSASVTPAPSLHPPPAPRTPQGGGADHSWTC